MAAISLWPWKVLVNSSAPSAAYMHRWTGSALVQLKAPSHYLNQFWVIVNWNLRNKFQWNFNQNTKFLIYQNSSEYICCEMVTILSRGSELISWGQATISCQTTICTPEEPIHYASQSFGVIVLFMIIHITYSYVYMFWMTIVFNWKFDYLLYFISFFLQYFCKCILMW